MKGLEQALERSPGILSTSVLLASAKLSQNDLKGAEDVLKKASDDAPNSSEAHKVLADFYIDRNRMSDAETHLRRALELDPKNEAALMDLARLQLTLGKKQEAEQGFKRLAASFNYRSVYGIFLFQDGRRDEAVREFEKLFKENPEDRAARTRLIVAYRVMNRPADVDRVVQAALKKNSRDLEAMLEWSEILIERGKFSDAETNLNLALKMNRTSPEVHYLFAKLNQARGSTLLYRQELAEALRLNPSLEAVRVELAADYTNNNDGHSARDLVDAAPESQRLSMPLLIQRNWAVWNMGDLAGMRQGIDRGLAQERSPELLIQDGLCRLKSGDPVSARKSLEEALKLNPEDLRALSLLNRTYLVEKNVPMALKKVAEYAAQQPKSAPVQDYLGVLLMVDGDRAQARSAFSAALAADPKFAPAEFSMVQIEVSEGKVNEARNRLAAILAKDKFNVTARRWLGNIEVMRGDTNAAIEHYQQVVSASPSDPQALNNLAYLLTEYRNQHDEALKYAQRAVELAPQRPAYCDTLGWVLYRKGLYTPAIKYLEIATTSKETVVSRYHLAMAYAKSGDLVRGKATLAAALKANPNVPEAKLAQQVVGESR
jgi:tetratricopeptide (TPR) repeat protein